jgi:hypothetical protein
VVLGGNVSSVIEELKEVHKKFMEHGKNIEKNPLGMKETLDLNKDLFAKMKSVFEKGSDQERKEALQLFEEVTKFLEDQAKVLSQKSIFSEKALHMLSKTPSMFSPEQWEIMQKINAELPKLQKEVLDALKVKK